MDREELKSLRCFSKPQCGICTLNLAALSDSRNPRDDRYEVRLQCRPVRLLHRAVDGKPTFSVMALISFSRPPSRREVDLMTLPFITAAIIARSWYRTLP